MKLIGVLQLVLSLAASLLGLWLYFWLSFCFEPTPFHFPARPGDCYLVNTSQPHVGLVLGFITSVAVAISAFIAAVGFLMSKPWARRLAILVALGSASSFVVLGLISSGLRAQFFIAAVLLTATVGVVRLRAGSNTALQPTGHKAGPRLS